MKMSGVQMKATQDLLSLERILFGWNATELICWLNRNEEKIQATTERSPYYRLIPGDEIRGELKLDADGFGHGIGPLKHSPWKIMVSWYDGQEEWPGISLPARRINTE